MIRPRENGFTLVELLVVITVISIILGVLGDSIVLGLKTTTATATTFTDANNSQALTSDLLGDIGGAETIGTSTTGSPCSPPSTPTPTTVLWTDDQAGPGDVYFVTQTLADPAQNTTAFSQLSRQPCGGQPVTLASWPGLSATPTVTCDGRLAECGGQEQLDATGLSASATQIDLDDVSAFPDPNGGSDPPQPYQITVGSEAMTVTAVTPGTTPPAGTLTVSRPAGVAHPGGPTGDTVTYLPASVTVTVPRSASSVCDDPSACTAGDDYSLTVSPSSS